ncbi:competence type IV pilus assembly protein ComGB [Marinilactibacillus piezotolerans]|uniref:competence type IV pilus assembly protein ComGB n=1 Tax=Marinilactibacillus piezotolerans TaxID=258723 RepID=UPI0009B06A95|nr:competence type IV pilus assembly protein ComGB [Marinilactibacillus piezotolerans]
MGLSQKKHADSMLFLSAEHSRAQGLFLKRIGRLLCEGFSLKEALNFVAIAPAKKQMSWAENIMELIHSGDTLSEALSKIGFSERICTQIYLAAAHGAFSETVLLTGTQMIASAHRKKKIQSIIQYPIMLLLFVLLMLLSMRYVLLPHIERIASPDSDSIDFGTRMMMSLVNTAPFWLIGLFVSILLMLIVIQRMMRNRSAIEKTSFYAGIRFIRPFIQLYWTQFFSHEWSQLLKSNCSFIQIVQLMQADTASILVREVGGELEKEMKSGKPFEEAIAHLPFLKSDFREIALHGQNSGKLASEMKVYASDCEEELNRKVEKLIEKIQPAVFIFVALMIIAIYAALLLPTFSMMKGL